MRVGALASSRCTALVISLPHTPPWSHFLTRSHCLARSHPQVTDNLREMMVCEESENAELYSEEEKAEFLWRVFEHMCLGGPCCQFEVGSREV